MQNRDDIDGSQRPATSDAPSAPGPAGHLGRGGDPAEGRDPAQPAPSGSKAPGVVDHLGAGGDPAEGKAEDGVPESGAT